MLYLLKVLLSQVEAALFKHVRTPVANCDRIPKLPFRKLASRTDLSKLRSV